MVVLGLEAHVSRGEVSVPHFLSHSRSDRWRCALSSGPLKSRLLLVSLRGTNSV